MAKRRAQDDAEASERFTPPGDESGRTKRPKTARYRPAYSTLQVTEYEDRPLDSSSTFSQPSYTRTPQLRPLSLSNSPESILTVTSPSQDSISNHSQVIDLIDLSVDLSALDLAGRQDPSVPRRDRRLRWSSSSSSRPPMYQYRSPSESVFLDGDDSHSDDDLHDESDMVLDGALRMDWKAPSHSSSSRNRRFAFISLDSPDPGSYAADQTTPPLRTGIERWPGDTIAPHDLLLGRQYTSSYSFGQTPNCPKALRISLDDPPPDPFLSNLPYSLSSRRKKIEPPSAPAHMRLPCEPAAALNLDAQDQADQVQATPMRFKADTFLNQFKRFKRPHDHWSPTPSPSPPSYTASMRGDYDMQEQMPQARARADGDRGRG